MTTTEHQLQIEPGREISALLTRPATAHTLLLLAHGAGAGMRHAFLEQLSQQLAAQGVATLRYQFLYMERGRRFPGPERERLAAVRAVVRSANTFAEGLPVVAGGKSMGGRMTSTLAAEEPLDGIHGLVFFGFPLHPAGKPGISRAEHLQQVGLPMLFLQGDRDKLGGLDLLGPVCNGLGPRAELHVVRGADHGFGVLKRSGRNAEEVLDELALETRDWVTRWVSR